jgi:hypothetical protein
MSCKQCSERIRNFESDPEVEVFDPGLLRIQNLTSTLSIIIQQISKLIVMILKIHFLFLEPVIGRI